MLPENANTLAINVLGPTFRIIVHFRSKWVKSLDFFYVYSQMFSLGEKKQEYIELKSRNNKILACQNL